jgi:glycosyltransferase involved in cell wall biosynthesis
MKSVYLMPVYNQVEEFPRVLDELKAAPLACDTLLIVNNGCTDGSAKLIHSSGYDYIDIPKNLGVGYSYMVALDWALERGYELFGTIASNGKMLPSEMARVMEPVLTGRADYVTGSRFLPGGAFPNLPRFRRGSIPMVNSFVQLLTGHKLSDATCGYRAFRLSIMKHAQFDWHKPWLYTYGFEYYLYAKVLLDPRIRSVEVPVTMRYPEAGKRYSKIKPFKGWYEMLKPFVVARFDGTGFADGGIV